MGHSKRVAEFGVSGGGKTPKNVWIGAAVANSLNAGAARRLDSTIELLASFGLLVNVAIVRAVPAGRCEMESDVARCGSGGRSQIMH